jgi:hypothetical protein
VNADTEGRRSVARRMETPLGFVLHELQALDLADDDDFEAVEEAVMDHIVDIVKVLVKRAQSRKAVQS